MATLVLSNIQQSVLEKRQWDFDFNGDLPTGVTVSSAVATHLPPRGIAALTTVGTISAGVVPVVVDKPTAIGVHYLSCVATFSDANTSEIRLQFEVRY